jgi:hypothetical protein
MLSILPLCLAPKLKAGARPLLDSDVFLPASKKPNQNVDLALPSFSQFSL